MSTSSRRLVIKFGSGILTCPGSAALDEGQFAQLCQAIAILRQQGHEVIVVSSGAVAAGLQPLGFSRRPEATSVLQACAAVGQSRLMSKYSTLLGACGLHVGQLLVTHQDFEDPVRREHFRNTLLSLLERGNIIPIINENDSVATEELRFGDNDALSARLAGIIHADLLILFTSVDGLMAPGETDAIVAHVADMKEVAGFARDEKGEFSVGGMASKLRAVGQATGAGVETIIANGRRPLQIPDLVAGAGVGTRFAPVQAGSRPAADSPENLPLKMAAITGVGGTGG